MCISRSACDALAPCRVGVQLHAGVMRVSLLTKTEDAHEDALWCVAWKPRSSALITGSVDETVKLWALEEGGSLEIPHSYTGHTLGVISVSVDASGTYAASSALDSFIRVWNLEVRHRTRPHCA